MPISIEYIPRALQHSQYDWANISNGSDLVGKARCDRHDGETTGLSVLVIYSINIFPEWAGHGYGREFVDQCKGQFEIIVADRVRDSAVGFWETMGFIERNDGNWVFCRNAERDRTWIYRRKERA